LKMSLRLNGRNGIIPGVSDPKVRGGGLP
jgi:hypothetical protein